MAARAKAAKPAKKSAPKAAKKAAAAKPAAAKAAKAAPKAAAAPAARPERPAAHPHAPLVHGDPLPHSRAGQAAAHEHQDPRLETAGVHAESSKVQTHNFGQEKNRKAGRMNAVGNWFRKGTWRKS